MAAAAPNAQPTGWYPVEVAVRTRPRSSRILAVMGIVLVKPILMFPTAIAVMVMSLIAYAVAWVGYWIVLFTGKMPPGMHKFLLGYLRYATWNSAWLFGLTDEYPVGNAGSGSSSDDGLGVADLAQYDVPDIS